MFMRVLGLLQVIFQTLQPTDVLRKLKFALGYGRVLLYDPSASFIAIDMLTLT